VNTQQAIREFQAAIESVIEIPNSWLPAELQDNVRGGRTIERLNELLDERDGITEHRKAKAAKARNIARLAAQFAAGREEFDYSQNERDELQLYRNECAMVDAMIASGQIDRDDLNDE
jgi:hypothetical protein